MFSAEAVLFPRQRVAGSSVVDCRRDSSHWHWLELGCSDAGELTTLTALPLLAGHSFAGSLVNRLAQTVLSREDPIETFFKSVPQGATQLQIIYPSSLQPSLVRRRTRMLAASRIGYHRRRIVGWGLLSVPQLPLMVSGGLCGGHERSCCRAASCFPPCSDGLCCAAVLVHADTRLALFGERAHAGARARARMRPGRTVRRQWAC